LKLLEDETNYDKFKIFADLMTAYPPVDFRFYSKNYKPVGINPYLAGVNSTFKDALFSVDRKMKNVKIKNKSNIRRR